MANRIHPMKLDDWSKLDPRGEFFDGIDPAREENFGIHDYNGALWTSGFVGVGRLYGRNGYPLLTEGKERVVVIRSRYQMDPWIMLEKVMTDSEYDDYVKELEANGKCLFRIFYNQPVIQLPQDQSCDADILYALSFVSLCYSLCKKGIKKKMIHTEENLTAKIRGRIDIQKNIRMNTSKGRDDRFYCKYIDFSADTMENRIVKAALLRCKKVIEQKFGVKAEISGRLYYCMNMLRRVKSVKIRNRDFNQVNVTGLYSYYQPLMKQAKCILNQKYYSYTAENGKTVSKSVYTVPYMINIETVFEFYVRTVFRENLDASKYYLAKYSEKIFLEKDVTQKATQKRETHLMEYCIPDIIIRDKATDRPVIVLDAKYKQDDRANREDSHQLLSYVLLLGVEKCGFVFPGQSTGLKQLHGNDFLQLNAPQIQTLKYYEFILDTANNDIAAEIQKLFL